MAFATDPALRIVPGCAVAATASSPTNYGIGLTDLVKVRGASSDGLLESSDYDRSGCIASDRARAPADAIVRAARLRPTKAPPVLNLGVVPA